MEVTATPAPPSSPAEKEAENGAAALSAAASGEKIDGAAEKSALDYLLGPTVALEYDVKVDYETEQGTMPLTFRFKQLDPSTFERIDTENRKGDGPFAKLDVSGFNVDLVTEATLFIMDASGRQVDIRSQDFLGGIPSPAMAMSIRFKNQGGLLDGIVDEVRRVSGYSADRVGTAQRAVVQAGKPS